MSCGQRGDATRRCCRRTNRGGSTVATASTPSPPDEMGIYKSVAALLPAGAPCLLYPWPNRHLLQPAVSTTSSPRDSGSSIMAEPYLAATPSSTSAPPPSLLSLAAFCRAGAGAASIDKPAQSAGIRLQGPEDLRLRRHTGSGVSLNSILTATQDPPHRRLCQRCPPSSAGLDNMTFQRSLNGSRRY